MRIKQVAPGFAVSEQLTPEDADSVRQEGFATVISNRPDGEGPDQPSSADLGSAFRRAGLRYKHVPVVPGAIDDEAVIAFRRELDDAAGPVLAFCRTGARAVSLWALARAPKLGADAVIRAAADAGYDLAPLRPRLELVATYPR